MYGQKKSPEFINQQTKDKSGSNNPMFGKQWTDSQRSANCTPIYVFDALTKELITHYPGVVEAKKNCIWVTIRLKNLFNLDSHTKGEFLVIKIILIIRE
jgi:hypothetical protein